MKLKIAEGRICIKMTMRTLMGEYMKFLHWYLLYTEEPAICHSIEWNVTDDRLTDTNPIEMIDDV